MLKKELEIISIIKKTLTRTFWAYNERSKQIWSAPVGTSSKGFEQMGPGRQIIS